MNRREASKQETRRLILEGARKLFTQKSMKECTLRDIAREVGVSPASIVVHFNTKTALFEEVLSADIRKALSRLMATMPERAAIKDQLMHLSKGMLTFYGRNRDIYRELLGETLFETTSDTPNMSRQSEEYIQFLTRLIEEQKKTGVIKPTVDPMVASAAIFFLYLGALTLLFRMPEMPVKTIANLLSAMTDQYLDGILRKPSRK
jgi:AcrR family transcriptional regulator